MRTWHLSKTITWDLYSYRFPIPPNIWNLFFFSHHISRRRHLNLTCPENVIPHCPLQRKQWSLSPGHNHSFQSWPPEYTVSYEPSHPLGRGGRKFREDKVCCFVPFSRGRAKVTSELSYTKDLLKRRLQFNTKRSVYRRFINQHLNPCCWWLANPNLTHFLSLHISCKLAKIRNIFCFHWETEKGSEGVLGIYTFLSIWHNRLVRNCICDFKQMGKPPAHPPTDVASLRRHVAWWEVRTASIRWEGPKAEHTSAK